MDRILKGNLQMLAPLLRFWDGVQIPPSFETGSPPGGNGGQHAGQDQVTKTSYWPYKVKIVT